MLSSTIFPCVLSVCVVRVYTLVSVMGEAGADDIDTYGRGGGAHLVKGYSTIVFLVSHTNWSGI